MDSTLYDIHRNWHDTHWWFQGRKKIVGFLLARAWRKRKKLKSIIDIGSGGGSMIAMLKKHASEVDILEPNNRLAYLIKKSGDSNNVYDVPLELFRGTREYSAASLFDVLEHIQDDMKALNKIHSMLETGGFIAITVPAYDFLWSSHDVKAGHFRRYTRSEIVKKLEACGFSVKRATYFNTILFPVVWAVRVFRKKDAKFSGSKSDFSFGATGAVNWLLGMMFSFEKICLFFGNFPFGVSIFCLAEKK